MKIAIISDSHDNLENLKIFFDFAKKEKTDKIIHCGDLTDLQTLKYLASNFSGEVFLADGNVDVDFIEKDKVKKYANVKLVGKTGNLEFDSIKIGFCHYPEDAEKLAETGVFDHVFYGHTHKPWQEKRGKAILSNPGTLAGMFYKATFAVLDTKTNKLELKILEALNKF